VATTEADGVPCVDVSDAKTGANFRFYDFEYQLALQLNGQPLAQVIAWAAQTYGVELKDEGIAEFSGRLSELGFLEVGATATEPAPESDSAADEWMSPQGTKTAQFVPDPAMLAGAPGPSLDRTPVASLDMLPPTDQPETHMLDVSAHPNGAAGPSGADNVNYTKFTNQELYGWMQGQLSTLYYSYYRLALDTARKAEATLKWELMRPEVDATSYIQPNYWDSGHQGLLAGLGLPAAVFGVAGEPTIPT